MLASDVATIGDRVARVVRDIAVRNGISRSLSATDGLVDGGLNSMAMVELMLSIEGEFDVMIPQAYLTPDNFRSIAAIEALMTRLDTPP